MSIKRKVFKNQQKVIQKRFALKRTFFLDYISSNVYAEEFFCEYTYNEGDHGNADAYYRHFGKA